MTRKEEIVNYANSFNGKGMENEELKEVIKLAIIDGALWADEHPAHKEDVNLEKELKAIDDAFFDLNGVAVKAATSYLTVEDVKDIAKYFFELGLKAKEE